MATREDDSPFGPPPDEQEAAKGRGGEEAEGPTLEDAFADAGEAEEQFVAGEGPAPEGADAGAAEEGEGGEEPSGEEEAGAEGMVRYRDPETGAFISAEEARERDLEPEELQTEEDAAEDLFGEEGPDEGGEEGEGEEEEEEHTVVLEAEGEEAEGLELVVDSSETAERIESMREAAAERDELVQEREQIEEAREQIAQDAAELQAIEEELATDPVPFLMEQVQDDHRSEIVRTILATDDEVFKQVAEDIETWRDDPRERRVAKAEMERDLTKKSTERRERLRQSREVQRNAREIVTALESTAQQVERGDPDLLISDLRNDIAAYADENERNTLSLQEIAEIPRVRKRLKAHGLEPEVLMSAHGNGTSEARRARGRNGREVVRAEPAGEEEEKLAEEAEKYREHGERLRKAYARKKDAASSTGAGAGAVPASGEVPSDATLEDAFDIADRRLGEGR